MSIKIFCGEKNAAAKSGRNRHVHISTYTQHTMPSKKKEQLHHEEEEDEDDIDNDVEGEEVRMLI